MNEIELRAELRRVMAQLGALMANAAANPVVAARLTGARTLLKAAHDVIKVPARLAEQEQAEAD